MRLLFGNVPLIFVFSLFFIINSYGYTAATKLNMSDAFTGISGEVFHGDSYYTVNGVKNDIDFSLTDRVINLEFGTPVNRDFFVYFKLPLLWREMDLDIFSEVNGKYILVKTSDYYRKGIGDVLFDFTYKKGGFRVGTSVNIPTGNSYFANPKIPLGLGRWNIYYFAGYVGGNIIKYRGEISYGNRRSGKYSYIDPYGVYFSQDIDFKDRLYLDGGVSLPLRKNYRILFNFNYYHDVANNKSNLLTGDIEFKYKMGTNEFSVKFNTPVYGKLYPDYPYLPQVFWSDGRPVGWSLILKMRWFDNENF